MAARQRRANRLGSRPAALAGLAAGLWFAGCTPYTARHAIQWDSRSQIWQAEASQVKVRAAQSRVLDTADRRRTLEAVVGAFQDLGFQVEVLDEELGIVSGKKFMKREQPVFGFDSSYYLYDEESLVVFTKAYRSWGPFRHRSDLVRLTVTVRERSPTQLIVRASAQFQLRPVEGPEPYQGFFQALAQAVFAEEPLRP
jgi:hypothetical protein